MTAVLTAANYPGLTTGFVKREGWFDSPFIRLSEAASRRTSVCQDRLDCVGVVHRYLNWVESGPIS